MGFSYKAATTKAVPPDVQAKQQQQIDQLMYRLAVDLADGVPSALVFFSDEFGCFLLPEDKHTWGIAGERQAPVFAFEDKRQYTGNLVINLDSKVVAFQCIFQGKTKRSVPMSEIAAVEKARSGKWPAWVPGHSENHWSNASEKKKLINKMAEYALDYFQEHLGLSAEAAKMQPFVVVLDCWRVNTSAEMRSWIKQTHPTCRLRFIPAGTTGQAQLNDVCVHGPDKKWIKSECDVFYQRLIVEQRRLIQEKKQTPEGMQAALKQGLCIQVLRAKAVAWNHLAMKRLQEPRLGTDGLMLSLLLRGIRDLYGKLFLPDFRAKAREELSKISDADVDQAVNELFVAEEKLGLHESAGDADVNSTSTENSKKKKKGI
jgi:hypothetical protein